MALRKWAYIYLSPGFDAQKNMMRSHSEQCEFIAIGVDFTDKPKVVELARQLYDEGVQMIELCGGFGPLWIAKVSEALQGAIPVGSVAYGPEARQPMLDLLAGENIPA
ncbi:MAG: DUF6506 family protein [Rhodanobacter sp.]